MYHHHAMSRSLRTKMLSSLLPLLLPLAASASPLGAGKLAVLEGQAWRLDVKGARSELGPGDPLEPTTHLVTSDAADTRVELRFPDGSLVRLGAATEVVLHAAERHVELVQGKVLVQSDPMVGGLRVSSRAIELRPHGTTYIVEQGKEEVDVTVLEGAVQAAPATVTTPASIFVLSGETLQVKQALGQPVPVSLGKLLAEEQLLAKPLAPLASLPRILQLSNQQKRGVLTIRNQRLRNELSWERPLPRQRVTVIETPMP